MQGTATASALLRACHPAPTAAVTVFAALLARAAGLSAGTAVLFALVHVATYGLWVLPVDLAAGALLGWQRHVTGSWTVPAYTHVIANVLVLL